MEAPRYRIAVRMNNVKHAFPGELGFVSSESLLDMGVKTGAIKDNHGGNTSASLIVWEKEVDVAYKKVVFHLLVDVGMGTIRSLAQASDFYPKRIDLILITHGHVDHHSELPYACLIPTRLAKRRVGGLSLEGERKQPKPVPIYASVGTAMTIAEKRYPYAITAIGGAPGGKFGLVYQVASLVPTNGRRLSSPVQEGPDRDHLLRITPVGGVGHDKGDALIYVVEFGTDDPRKIVFAWDMQYVPWDGLSIPEAEAAKVLLSNADLVFIAMNTCLARSTGHGAYDTVAEFLNTCPPKSEGECYVVHYSGLEDQFSDPDRGDTNETLDIMSHEQLNEWLTGHSQNVISIQAAQAERWYPSDGWAWQ